MEHSIPNIPSHRELSPLESQVRELFGRTAYSHKTHEKCADIYFCKLHRLKLWQVVLSALATGSLVTELLGGIHIGQWKVGVVAGAVFSTVLLGLNAYTKDHDLGEMAQKHAEVASKLWSIRERYLSLLTDLAS